MTTDVLTAEEFPAFLEQRFGGKLTKGAHSPDGAACVHEAINIFEGRPWSDAPGNRIDLRDLNDAPWSTDEVRTEHLLRVALAVWDWPQWSATRHQAFARRVSSETIRRILPIALRAAASVHRDEAHKAALTKAAATCADEGTESAASAAAWSARSAAESSAAWSAAAESAWSAESAARSAAWSARSAAADEPLRLIATIFVEAAEATREQAPA